MVPVHSTQRHSTKGRSVCIVNGKPAICIIIYTGNRVGKLFRH